MSPHDQPARYLVAGSALGAAIRFEVADKWQGASPSTLAATAATMLVAAFVAGLALGLRARRARAFVLGIAGGAASFSFYGVLGVTTRLAPGLLFLVVVPVLMAVAVTLGTVSMSLPARLGLRTERNPAEP